MDKSKDQYHLKKLHKAEGEVPSEIEQEVAKALLELEVTSKDLGAKLRELHVNSVKEISLGGKSAIVIFVPFRQHKKFQQIQSRLIRELEKKFSGRHVCFVAQRTIYSTHYKRQQRGQMRPRSRTLTSVHNSILEDVCYPTQIVGKRTRVRLDGTKMLKVYLDPKDVKEVEYKLKTFGAVYKSLTNKNVDFAFPVIEE